MDATFKVRPHHDMFGQLLNILVVYKDFAIPVCHVLMNGKDEVSLINFLIKNAFNDKEFSSLT